MSRTPIVREKAILDEFQMATNYHRGAHKVAYCTATRELSIDRWNGDIPVHPGMDKVTIKKGTTLRIVRMMRNGMLGIGDEAGKIVQAVVPQFDDSITDIRWTKEPTHFDPQDVADQQFDAMMDNQEEEFT